MADEAQYGVNCSGVTSTVLIRRRWLALVAGLGITPMIALAASDNGTITVGDALSKTGGVCVWGYDPPDIGSYSPTGLTGGKTVSGLFTLVIGPQCLVSLNGHFFVSGFSSDPGQSWLTSVTCNGTTKTGGTASYSYASGTAYWGWSATTWGFTSNVGSQLGCTVVHS